MYSMTRRVSTGRVFVPGSPRFTASWTSGGISASSFTPIWG